MSLSDLLMEPSSLSSAGHSSTVAVRQEETPARSRATTLCGDESNQSLSGRSNNRNVENIPPDAGQRKPDISLMATTEHSVHSQEAKHPKCCCRILLCLKSLQKTVRTRFKWCPVQSTRPFHQRFYFDQMDSVEPLNNIRDLTDRDSVLLVMGPTGAGKSTFIQTLLGNKACQDVEVGHSLCSTTKAVNALRIIFKGNPEANLVLVDTPGFGDIDIPDAKVFGMVLSWFKRIGLKRTDISTGVLYLYRITDNRIPGSVAANFRLFRKICGKEFYKQVILVTTMWPDSSDTAYERYQKRETDLKENYWNTMMAGGSTVLAFNNSVKSARDIVNELSLASNKTYQSQHQSIEGGGHGLDSGPSMRENNRCQDVETRAPIRRGVFSSLKWGLCGSRRMDSP
ncbi:hypothetical protein D9756_006865 [Leucocoprinus leucothites]|uniref:AAA+ ATPase domain-containing protein n=1 Tax=Leucocoprinus leucothites TaxID=201217 RepID=A0A8H5G246_9AGAR|nr:hypothetical protein D9756_006865 [Leucoagaricus leucothites]